ncbi:MAG: DUF4900 domain-containing protein, partial [Candidatus Omnitrophota bacterium]
TSVYFSSLMTEKRGVDTEEYVLQALALAEAGASHGLSELRERIRTDLDTRVQGVIQSSIFLGYVDSSDSLGFLRDYAWTVGDAQFTISGLEATIEQIAEDAEGLGSRIQGSYSWTIVVKADGNPTNLSGDRYIFPYVFSIESLGQVTNVNPPIQKRLRLVQGNFSITTRRDNISKFALFTAHHRTSGNLTVWFTEDTNFTGPVHTNERFSFANNPGAHFTEDTTQHNSNARFYNNGRPILRNADNNSDIDVPIFDKGFQRSEDIINLTSSVTQDDLRNQALGGMADPGNGIHVPNDGACVKGGIYVRGNQGQSADDAVINMSVGVNGPIYAVSQSSTTHTITVDYVNLQTQVETPSGTNTYCGIPDGTGDQGIILYVNDDIGGLGGTVQKDSGVTISSERDIVITDNVVYEQYNPDPLNAEGYTNLLGILSWGGNVRIGTSAPDNVNIHGVVMAPHGVFEVDSYRQGSPRGEATLLGGVITDFYGPFGTFDSGGQKSGYARNFIYDARMLAGMVPPYFPYLSNFISTENGLNTKLIWEDQGA